MSETNEHLWTRKRHDFIVEILVGRSWTEHERKSTIDEAVGSLRKVMRENALAEARIREEEITQVGTLVWHEKASPIFRVPDAMKNTGEPGKCPVCDTPAKIAFDGRDRWAFCAECRRATPVN